MPTFYRIGSSYMVIVFSTMVSLLLLSLQLPAFYQSPELPAWADSDLIKAVEKTRSQSNPAVSCQFPKLELFPTKLRRFWKESPRPLECESDRFPNLFKITNDPVPKIVPRVKPEVFEKLEIEKCCAQGFQRGVPTNSKYDDDLIDYSPECPPISLQGPTLINRTGFFSVECTLEAFFEDKWIVDVLTTVSDDKPAKTESSSTAEHWNVIFLGVDGCSRLSLMRTMPKVYKFLTFNLSAVDMEMYHKVGENTLPNVLALLANTPSKMDGDITAIGNCEKNGSFDDCPFLWKDFKSAGYRTLFAEDSKSLPIFNMRKEGFHEQPTDYYLRPVFLQFDKDALAHESRELSQLCYGPRTAFEVVLDYMEQVTVSMERQNQPYFHFGWIGSVTHDVLNGGRLQEQAILDWLEDLHSRKYFENTVLFFGSDHGSRVTTMASHKQGFIEEKHPFMLISVPPAFRNKYSKLYTNLRENSNRLTTPWDVYQTIHHILKLSSPHKAPAKDKQENDGISLFKSVPKDRTCEDAQIPERMCTCNLNFESIPTDAAIVGKCVTFMLDTIHSKLAYIGGMCEQLRVKHVKFAEKAVKVDRESHSHLYRIVIETNPFALFEGMITVNVSGLSVLAVESGLGRHFEGSLARMDLYGPRSKCVDELSVKPFCVCRKILAHPYHRQGN